MLTKKSVDGMGRFVTLGRKGKLSPFDWNYKSSRVEIGSRKQRAAMTVIMIYMYFEATYHVHRLVTDYRDESVSFSKYMKLVELFVSKLTGLLVQTIAFVYCEDIKYFLNQLLNMNDRFIEIYGRNHVKDPWVKMYSIWYWFVSIHPVLAVIVYALDNKDSRYWHGALLPTGIQPFFVPVFMLVEYWTVAFNEIGCATIGAFAFAYFKATPVWMNELTAMVRKMKNKCEKVITLYRALLILNRAFNNAFSVIELFGYSSLLADLTITLTCSIRLTPAMGLPGLKFPIGSLAFILIAELVVRPLANLASPSSDFMATFSRVTSTKRCCGTKRRGHVKNMEKERKRFMKSKKCLYSTTSSAVDNEDGPKNDSSNRRTKGSWNRWNDAVVRIIHGQTSQLATHFRVTPRLNNVGKAASAEDSIEVIELDEVRVHPVVSLEKRTSLALTATAKSMYPMFVKCFIFFEFEKATMFNFYSVVVDQTLSALLLAK